MSATTTMEIGCDLRNVRVYAGLALAAELSVAMDKPRRAAISLFFLWRTYRRLGSLNRGLEELIEAYEQNCSSAPVASVEQYRFERDLLLGLHAFCARILSPQEGVPKLGLMSKKLARLQINAERLMDLADWLDALSTPEEMNAKFDSALADLERGDVVSWAAVQ